MEIEDFYRDFIDSEEFGPYIIQNWTTPAKRAELAPFPSALDPRLARMLENHGVQRLYSHQVQAFNKAMEGRHVSILTGTASGKSLCYSLPIMQSLLHNPQQRALLLFPTKALAQDQKEKFMQWVEWLALQESVQQLSVATYDGDTPANTRDIIRNQAKIIISNPDMLHLGILPHHSDWEAFFRNLRWIVLDEVHIYRGIFGSHVANILRRIKRICAFYQSKPQLILTSATVHNSEEFLRILTELDIDIIQVDGSAQGEKRTIIYNPPLVNASLGIRRSPLQETVRIALFLLQYDLQSIVFSITRPTIELIRTYLLKAGVEEGVVRSYRSGYLPAQRREIERYLRQGKVKLVVATNALELGVDVGGIDVVIICGYPGTIASFRQQSGRAGRQQRPAITIFVLTPSPLDQFLGQHIEYLRDKSPEKALLAPDNPYVLLQHLQCAVFERPFTNDESFGNLAGKEVAPYLQYLQQQKQLLKQADSYYWSGNSYPASESSLRAVTPHLYILKTAEQLIGKLDETSAFALAYPGAVYLQDGEIYLVEQFDYEKKMIILSEGDPGYYTKPQRNVDISSLSVAWHEPQPFPLYYGKLKVTSQITTYTKYQWHTQQLLDIVEISLPPTDLFTEGFWIGIPDRIVDKLIEKGVWTNQASHYGPNWKQIQQAVRERDEFTCQACGMKEGARSLEVHHKEPIRMFSSLEQANKLDNLITLCPSCHRAAEKQVMIKSGMAGVAWLLRNLVTLYLMCSERDIDLHWQQKSDLTDHTPAWIFYDQIQGGMGLSYQLKDFYPALLRHAYQTIVSCECKEGCPSCVGPASESGFGAKVEATHLLQLLLEEMQKDTVS